MASKLYPDYEIQTAQGTALCDVECYSDHQGSAVFAVYGHTERDQALINAARVDTAKQLKADFSEDAGREVNDISLYVDRGNNRLEASRFNYDADKNPTEVFADPGNNTTSQEVSNIGEKMDAKDWAHQQDLFQNNFNPNNRPNIPR
jgi:hypothetical protein